VTVGVVVILVVTAGLVAYLLVTQRSASGKIYRGFDERAALAARLTGGLLSGSEANSRSYAEALLAGPEAGLQVAFEGNFLKGDLALALRASDNSPLAVYPRSLGLAAAKQLFATVVERSHATGKIAYGDLVSSDSGAWVPMALPYTAKQGKRVLAMSLRVGELAEYTNAFLSSTLGVSGGRAYIVDQHTGVIASVRNIPDKRSAIEPAVGRALAQGVGSLNGDRYSSALVPDSTWRVIFVVPTSTLLEPVRSTRAVSWSLLGALVVAMVFLVMLGAVAVKRSARLAHARLHDSLTGLPNRALFLDLALEAIRNRSRGGFLAALFIDLDGFKAVNDEHGHSVGDALLTAVAERLTATVNGSDVVGRMGGDEFLVLCKGIGQVQEAAALAERIKDALARPFQLGGLTVTVGSSIGIASYDGDVTSPEGLIHNADLAMYRAKRDGKGRVVPFDPAMISTVSLTPQ
jgi:diguanylate cyclase (GGDEF)-like protein